MGGTQRKQIPSRPRNDLALPHDQGIGDSAMKIDYELLNGTQVSRAIWKVEPDAWLDNLFAIEMPYTVIVYFNWWPAEKQTNSNPGISEQVEVFRIEIPELSGSAAESAIALLMIRSEQIEEEILDMIKNERAET